MLLAVAIGGALGSVLRYLLVKAAAGSWASAFPWGTLGVNLIGSLMVGVLYVLLVERTAAAEPWRGLLIVGVLGGFTTFSAFSLDTVRLIEQGALALATANVLANVLLSIGACALAMQLARHWS